MNYNSGSLKDRLTNRRGVVIVFVAIMVVVLLGFTGLAIDIGYVMVVRNELQNVSDAASLAATRQLGYIYQGKSYQEQQAYVCDPGTIKPIAQQVAATNEAGGKSITVNDADIIIGQWKDKNLYPTLDQPDAVRVISRRDTTANGPISTFFAKVLGRDTFDVSATATAALTGQSTIDKGKLFPVGISEEWFRNKDVFCDQVIKFYPTNTPEGCAGWSTYDHWPASESYLRKDILEPWAAGGGNPSPGAKMGDNFVFTGGTLGNNTFQAFLDLFNYMKTHDDDNNPDTWTGQVVVYKSDSCSNPTGNMEISGFATVIITNVVPPNVEITAQVICEEVVPARGGGGEYGTKGSIPGLVQ